MKCKDGYVRREDVQMLYRGIDPFGWYDDKLNAVPNADVQVVVYGQWVECGDNQPISCDKVYCCSHCHENKRFEWQLKPFCQECGAKMQNYKIEIL